MGVVRFTKDEDGLCDKHRPFFLRSFERDSNREPRGTSALHSKVKRLGWRVKRVGPHRRGIGRGHHLGLN